MSEHEDFATTAESSRTELTGEIVGLDPRQRWVAADVELEGDGGETRRAKLRAEFVLRTDDGHEVRVRTEGAELVSPPSSESKRERWGSLAPTWVGGLFPEYAAGPQYPVRAHAAGYRAGERATVRGTIEERALASGHGYRGGSTTPSVIRAEAIAPEQHARAPQARQDDSKRFTAKDLGTVLGILICAAFVILATLVLPPPTRVVEIILRGGWIAFGLANGWLLLARLDGYPHVCPSAPRRRYLPAFYRVKNDPTDKVYAGDNRDFHLAILTAFVMVEGIWGTAFFWTPVLLWAPAVIAWALAGTTLGLLHRSTRAALRMSRSLLAALEAPTESWSAIVGTLADPLARCVTVVPSRLGVFRAVYMQQSFAVPQLVRVETSDGLMQMDLRDAWWGPTESSSELLPPDAPALPVTAGSDEQVLAGTEWEMRAPRGASVLVAGDLRTGEVLRARGPESLLVFTTSPGTDPRRILRRAVTKHFLTWIFAAAGVLYVVVQLALL